MRYMASHYYRVSWITVLLYKFEKFDAIYAHILPQGLENFLP